jgi:trigger factor
MQVSVEATGGLERRMTIQVPAERIEKEVESRLKDLTRTARVAGFRPGKVPLKVVERKYGAQVRREVVGEVLQSSFYEAIRQEELRPAGGPRIEASEVAPGQALEYKAIFEVYPQFDLGSLEGGRIERPAVEVTDADVDRVIENLRRQRVTWTPVERPAQKEDRVLMDFEGTVDGEPFPGNKGEQVPVILGSGRLIPGFEDGLVDAAAGEERMLDLQFPQDYPATELAGKPVRFQVKVISVSEPKLPEVNEDFARSFGVAEGSVEGLRSEVRQNMERELEQTVKGKVKEQVMQLLLDKNPIEVPKTLVDEEAQRLMEQTRSQAAGQNFELPRELFEEQARRRVTLGLVIAEVVKSAGLKVDPARVRATIEAMAATYENPEEVVKWYYGNRNLLQGVESLVLEDQVVDHLLQQLEVVDAPTSFESLMSPGQSSPRQDQSE